MNLGTYGILIAFAAFILLMILNPKLSCFGKRITSPLYPLLRKRQKKAPAKVPTEDYGFKLSENPPAQAGPPAKTVARTRQHCTPIHPVRFIHPVCFIGYSPSIS